MITKSAALDRFINERVLGDRGFAWNAFDRKCVYSHSINGGCEIGQYLDPEEADRLGTSTISHLWQEGRLPMAEFEGAAPVSGNFWRWLQIAHDALAEYIDTPPGEYRARRTLWDDFEESLRGACEAL
jgi:hypothetical protein